MPNRSPVTSAFPLIAPARLMSALPPMSFDPWLRQARWGGRRLETILRKPLERHGHYAESWEIADHSQKISEVTVGPLAGSNLRQLIRQEGRGILGRHAPRTRFPLLLKFLDANDWLSLQVHPNNQQAVRYSEADSGKTECWVVISAEPESEICCGLKKEIDRSAFESAVRSSNFDDVLHRYPVSAGDCIFVPAGILHAIGPGILLAEIQQQSDLTFRVHDWDYVDAQGKSRELHVTQAMACIDFDAGPVNPIRSMASAGSATAPEELVNCEFFRILRYTTEEEFNIPDDDQFRILMTLDGHAELSFDGGTSSLTRGQTVLLPASCTGVKVVPGSPITMLKITLD